MSDNHKNFAYSTIATTPSPAISGTSLTIATGDGSKFPAPPFNCTVWPASGAAAFPNSLNAEIIRITALSGDVFTTIARQQESSTARTIQIGDQIAATISVKSFTDIEIGIAPTFTTLSDSLTTTQVMDTRFVTQNNTITLSSNTVLALSGLTSGMTGILIVKQDAVGSRSLTLPVNSKVVNSGIGAVTLTTTASAIDILGWVYDGTNLYWTTGLSFT